MAYIKNQKALFAFNFVKEQIQNKKFKENENDKDGYTIIIDPKKFEIPFLFYGENLEKQIITHFRNLLNESANIISGTYVIRGWSLYAKQDKHVKFNIFSKLHNKEIMRFYDMRYFYPQSEYFVFYVHKDIAILLELI